METSGNLERYGRTAAPTGTVEYGVSKVEYGVAKEIAKQPPPSQLATELPTCPAIELSEPTSFAKADRSEYAHLWCGAMAQEFDGLAARGGSFWGGLETREAKGGHSEMTVYLEGGRTWQCGQGKGDICSEGIYRAEGYYSETLALTHASPCIQMSAYIAYGVILDVCHFEAEQAFVQSEFYERSSVVLPCAEICALDGSSKNFRIFQ